MLYKEKSVGPKTNYTPNFGMKSHNFELQLLGHSSLCDTIDSNQTSLKAIRICNFRRIAQVYVGILVKNRILGQIWAQNDPNCAEISEPL